MNSKILVLGTVLIAGLLVSPQARAQSTKGPQDINIKQVGGAAVGNTVPVSGSVSVTGTVPVSGAVSVTGTVPVSGSVGTQDRDNKARNYFQTYNLNCGYLAGMCAADLPVVPAGKRLIIEHVSGEADMSAATDLYRIALWSKNQWPSAYFEFGPPRLTFNNLYAHAFNARIFAAFDAGETPQLILNSNGAGGFAWQAVLTGYLIDLP